MSTDIDVYQGQQETTLYASDPTGGRLVAWAASLFAAKQIADALCATTFAPAHFRGKPDDGAAAIMFGDEIGLSPTQALRSIYVISGSPALYARQMVAIVLHHGHEVWTEEKSDAKVTVCGKRRGSSHIHTETWTTARAQKAGYLSNKKYASDPQAMLYARAASDVCRQIAPDALAGLAYTVEEMEMQEPAPTVRAVRAKAAPVPMPEPDLTPQTDDGGGSLVATSVAEGEAGSIPAGNTPPSSPPGPEAGMSAPGTDEARGDHSTAQLAKIHILLGEQGMGERVAGLACLSDILDREVTSTKTLTKREAGKVIEALMSAVETLPEPPFDEAS